MDETEKKPLKNFGGGKCSEMFERAFCGSSSLVISCTACGRLHYTDGYLNDYEEGEYEKYVAGNAADPNRYVSHDDYAGWGYFLGMQVVVECPCGFAAKLEESIWNGRYFITRYLREKTDEQMRFSLRDQELAASLPDTTHTA